MLRSLQSTRIRRRVATSLAAIAVLTGITTPGRADAAELHRRANTVAAATSTSAPEARSRGRSAGELIAAWEQGATRGLRPYPRHRATTSPTAATRIINGSRDVVTNWPWIASLQDIDTDPLGRHLCGGSLVDDEWVLTAAHCVGRGVGDPDVVVLGQSRLSAVTGQRIDIDAIVTWPFGETTDGQPRDLAMLHLATPADTARPEIEPIPVLAPGESSWAANGLTAHTAGWGVTSWTNSTTPDQLRATTVDLIGRVRCNDAYESYAMSIDGDSWVCGGTDAVPPSALGQGPCFGDSGGPLVVFDPGDSSLAGARLLGATSFGIECGSAYFPSVWARVTAERATIAGLIAGSTANSALTFDMTTSAITVVGTDGADFIPVFCAGGHLWIQQVRVAVGGTPETCPGSGVTSLTINTGGRTDRVLLTAIDSTTMSSLSGMAIDLGVQAPGAQFADELAIVIETRAPSTITSSPNAIAFGSYGPSTIVLGTELFALELGAADDSIDFADLGIATIVDSGGGDDTVTGSALRDTVFSGEGDDAVEGGSGDDDITGGSDKDDLSGGGDDDLLVGDGLDHSFDEIDFEDLEDLDDLLNSLLGNGDVDVVRGNGGDDTISWGPPDGSDLVSGGPGADTVRTDRESDLDDVIFFMLSREVASLGRAQGFESDDLFEISTRIRVTGHDDQTTVHYQPMLEVAGEFPPGLLDELLSLLGLTDEVIRIADADNVIVDGTIGPDRAFVSGPAGGLHGIGRLTLRLHGSDDNVATAFFRDTAQTIGGNRGHDQVAITRNSGARIVGQRALRPGFAPIVFVEIESARLA